MSDAVASPQPPAAPPAAVTGAVEPAAQNGSPQWRGELDKLLRTRPEVFVVGAFAVGFLISRLASRVGGSSEEE